MSIDRTKLMIGNSSLEDLTPSLKKKAARWRRLKTLMGDEQFLSEQRQIKNSISMGGTLDEALDKAGVDDHSRRDLHLQALGIFSSTPEVMMLHYRERSRLRYQMLMDLWQRSKEAKDRKTEFQCILAMCKLDASEVDLARALGLIKIESPDGIPEDGIDSEEMRRELQRIEDEVRSRIEDLRTAAKPIALELQPRSFAREAKDTVVEATISEDPT